MPTTRTAMPNFQNIFDSLPGLIVVIGPDFTIIGATDQYLEAAKSKRADVIGRGYFEVFPDNLAAPNRGGADDVRQSFLRVLKTRQAEKMPARKYDRPSDYSALRQDVRYWQAVNSPVLAEDGEVAYIIRRVDDVSDIVVRDGEREFIEKERDLIFNHAVELIAVVGRDGYFKRLNPAFERTLGYTNEELCAHPIVHFLHPDDVNTTNRRLQKLSSGMPTYESINRYRCKDGRYMWISWNTTPLGETFYSVGRDITEQKRSEEQIRELNLELGKKNEDLEIRIQERLKELSHSEAQVQQLQKMDAVGRLAGGIAHDFNNMLAAITLYGDLALRKSDKTQFVRENIQNIMDVTKRATDLTRQLLVFSRKQIVQLQSVNLNQLIQDLEKMLARLIGEQITLETRLEADLKSVSVDPSQIEQVILNLVVNARDAMPKGGKITLQTDNVILDEEFTSKHLSVKPGPYVLLCVSDEGSGMDSATMEQIFEPFFTTKPVGQGTGLGLTTTYGIIKQSKGTIWVYSEVGQGTVFKIYLPVALKLNEKTDAPVEKFVENSGTETILLVEDDEKLRAGFFAVLDSTGYQVLVASNGQEALEICRSHAGPIHLLLSDMVMPGMSGVELADRVHEIRGEPRVLFMSGYASDALENMGTENLAALQFIQKPFGISALLAKVQEVLRRK